MSHLSAAACAISVLLIQRISWSASFTPVQLTPDSYNHDIIVEASASDPNAAVTAKMDSMGFTWYELGFNTNAPATGLPHSGIFSVPATRHRPLSSALTTPETSCCSMPRSRSPAH